MSETVISPSGPGACEAGLMIDETGTRFVVLTFREPETNPVIVTFTVPLFQRYLGYLARTAEASRVEANWAMGPPAGRGDEDDGDEKLIEPI